MEAMKNVPSAHVSGFKLLKEFHLVFGICYKIHSLQELSINEGEYHKKKNNFDSFYLVFNSYALTLVK